LAAEERHLDLLALVLVGVILHGRLKCSASHPAQDAVLDGETAVRRVLDDALEPPLLGERKPCSCGVDRPYRTAVADHEDVAPVHGRRELVDGLEHPLGHLRVRLAVVPALAAARPALVAIRIALADLGVREPREAAD